MATAGIFGIALQTLKLRHLPIRTQLLLLMAAMMLPAIAGLAWFIERDREKARDAAYAQVDIAARGVVAQIAAVMSSSETMLAQLALRHSVQALDPRRCEQLFKEHLMLRRESTVLVLRDATGRLICTSRATGTAPEVSGSAWFRQALASGGFAVGGAFLGPTSGRWAVNLTYPVRDAAGAPSGLLIMGIDLLKLQEELLRTAPPKAHLAVFDRDYVFLMRSIEPERWLGKPLPAPQLAHIEGRDEAHFSAPNILGVTQLWSLVRMRDIGWSVSVGLPEDEVIAAAGANLTRSLAVGVGIVLLMLAAAWLVSRPIRDLARTSAALMAGDAAARAEVSGPAEVEAIAAHFNRLLDDRELALQRLRAQEADLRIAATAFESQEGMMVTDAEGVILRVNRAFTAITGYAQDEIVGQTPRLLKSGHHEAGFYHRMWEDIKRDGSWNGEIWDRRKNGETYPKWLTISAVRNAAGEVTHYVGAQTDITERKRAEERINELAFFDQLTGLPNRTLLQDRLGQEMTASVRSGSYAALLFIDLDDFKTLNDALGHEMGDSLLKQVAQRLVANVREGDSVARLGGDDFVAVLTDLGQTEREAADATEAAAEKMLAALDQTYALGEHAYHSTASIGATLFRGQAHGVDELMKQADLTLYRAKASGRRALRFFDPAMEAAVTARAALQVELRQAIAGRRLLLHYQPQIAGEAQLTGAEALVRWQHAERGLVPPGDFIPVAEESGLIVDLGRWVLETACGQLAQWATKPHLAQLTLAVNVSARQFRQADFVDQVLAVLAATGANPHRLKLELTESLLVDNLQHTVDKMFALKAKGVGFSLDDFGTGYSSLSYLKRLPLDQLKIDQSFVCDVLADPNDAAIARTVVALAQSLGLGVIAEGVETAEQREFLAASGCHVYQGYFFSRPLPLAEFEAYALRASA